MSFISYSNKLLELLWKIRNIFYGNSVMKPMIIIIWNKTIGSIWCKRKSSFPLKLYWIIERSLYILMAPWTLIGPPLGSVLILWSVTNRKKRHFECHAKGNVSYGIFWKKKNRNAQKQLNKFCHQSFKEEARLHSFPKKIHKLKVPLALTFRNQILWPLNKITFIGNLKIFSLSLFLVMFSKCCS